MSGSDNVNGMPRKCSLNGAFRVVRTRSVRFWIPLATGLNTHTHRWGASRPLHTRRAGSFSRLGTALDAAPHADGKCVQWVPLKAASRLASCIMPGGGFAITSKVSAAHAPSRP
jgi:hypothetical protein